MDLINRRCAACRADTPTLSLEAIIEHQSHVPQWKTVDTTIVRTFHFNTFKDALAFFNKVALIAEEEDHHPDMSITEWRKVTLSFTSHAANGLTENDFIMAAKMVRL